MVGMAPLSLASAEPLDEKIWAEGQRSSAQTCFQRRPVRGARSGGEGLCACPTGELAKLHPNASVFRPSKCCSAFNHIFSSVLSLTATCGRVFQRDLLPYHDPIWTPKDDAFFLPEDRSLLSS